MDGRPASPERLTIGTLARRVGIRPSALRYYEGVGILPPPTRVGGQRRYEPQVVDTLRLVALAQDAGFTIAEIRHLLTGFDRGTPASKRWQVLATKKREDIGRRIEQAKAMQRVLDALLACTCSDLESCVQACNPRHQLLHARA
ncbi:MAG TPA: MerR family transcriptional regulator [Gemmatimonadaceae bacterium]